jgi:hypothetical protein
MTTPSRSLASRNRRWRLLLENSATLLEEIPHLWDDLAELKQVTEGVSALQAEQAVALGKLREITARLRAQARRADRIRGRLGASLRGKYGFDSTVLIRLGFKPRRPGKPLEGEDGGGPGEGGEE